MGNMLFGAESGAPKFICGSPASRALDVSVFGDRDFREVIKFK